MLKSGREKIRKYWSRFLIPVIGGGIGVLALAIGVIALTDYSESAAFCGQLCHESMYPEYTVYQASPHSDVPCGRCHVGSGVVNLVESKIKGMIQLKDQLTGNYPHPITSPVTDLRPASQTCEQCHSPQKFTGELLKSLTTYRPDENNKKQTSTIVLRIDGGQSGSQSGIHWHSTAKVWYLPLDSQRLDIAWVGVEKNGVVSSEWINPSVESSLSQAQIDQGKRLMDCIDCHNRATHIFSSPSGLIDQAMQKGQIDSTLPFLKKKAVEILDPPSKSLDEAAAKIQTLAGFYQQNYPQIYTQKRDKINEAMVQLNNIAQLTTFPDMNVDWTTHSDNSGHNKPTDQQLAGTDNTFNDWKNDKSNGCFRCHGTLVAFDQTQTAFTSTVPVPGINTQSTALMDASCNLCHYSPPSTTGLPVAKKIPHDIKGLDNCLICHAKDGPKPFLPDHPWGSNEVCRVCHTPSEQLSTSPTAGPVDSALIKDVPHQNKGLENCLVCHSPVNGTKPISANHPWATNDVCLACHKTSPQPVTIPLAQAPPSAVPAVPHSSRGLENCLLCHGINAPLPLHKDHPWATVETCRSCHLSDPNPTPLPATQPLTASNVHHRVTGLEDCRLCHLSSVPFPDNHVDFSNSSCKSCHKEAPVPVDKPTPPAAPDIIHSISGLTGCSNCHGTIPGVPFTPSHAGRTDDMCLICHKTGPQLHPPVVSTAPNIPHSLAGRSACTSCHTSSGPAPFPVSHDGRTDTMCTVCHKPSPVSQAMAVSTGSASSVTTNSAILSGNLINLGGAASVSVSIQWGTASGSYSSETMPQSLAATGTFQSTVTGLTPDTKYFYRAKAVSGSTVYGIEGNFTTTGGSGGGGGGGGGGSGALPVVTTGNATGITASAATLNGSLDNLGGASSVNLSFQWGTASGSYNNETPSWAMGTTAPCQANITGLSAATIYYFRAKAVGSSTVYGSESSFVTGQAGTPPSVTTNIAVNITPTSATLRGTFNGLGSAQAVNISFQWGNTPGIYTNETQPTTMGTTAPFQANITGLSAATIYYFRAKAVGAGTAYGTEMSFIAGQSGASPNTPVVTTGNATNITSSSAALRASLDGLGSLTSINVSFQWGTAPGSYANETTTTTMGTTGIIQFELTGLNAGTTFYFRSRGTNGNITVYGAELSFTTP